MSNSGDQHPGAAGSATEVANIEDRYRRRWLPTVLLLLIPLPLIGVGAHFTMHNMLTMPSRWLPLTTPEQASLERFIEEFDTGDAVLLSWHRCSIDDPRLAEIAEAVREIRESPARPEHARYFDTVMDGNSVLRELMGPPLNLSREEALQRIEGTLVGPDGDFSCVFVALTEEGLFARQEAIPLIVQEASRICDLPEEDFLLAGPPVEGATLDRKATFDANTLSIPSTIVSALLCWWFLGSWRFTAVVLATALFGQGLVLAAMWWFDVRMSAILIVLPTLVLVLTVSAGVHLVNYYYDAVRKYGQQGAVVRALGSGRRPCLLAAFTSAMGLLSLGVSDIEPIVRFGIFAAAGVLAAIAVLLLILPAALAKWPAHPAHNVNGHSPADRNLQQSDRFIDSLAAGLARYSWLLIFLFVGGTAAAGYGLQKIETSISFDGLFPANSRISDDYAFLERHLGPLVPIEVVLHFDQDGPLTLREQLDIVERVEAAVKNGAHIDGTLSAADFSPDIPESIEADEQLLAMAQQMTLPIQLLNPEPAAVAAALPATDDLPPQNTAWAATAFSLDHSQQTAATVVSTFQPTAIPTQKLRPPETVDQLVSFSRESTPQLVLKLPPLAEASPAAPPIPTFVSPPWELIEERTIAAIDDDVREGLVDRRFLHETDERQSFRISARVPALLGIDYHESLQSLQTAVDPLLEDLDPAVAKTVTAEYTGVMPVVSKAQRVLLKDLYGSFLTAFALVGVVMVFVLRSLPAGLLAMLPNVFPAIVVFGLMGWLDVPVDIGAMMTASVALGIAVDDTLHFLNWFRMETARGLDRREAVRLSLRHCARAMTQTTIICGLGMVVFAFSGFVPSQRFSWLMFTLLAATLVGDLIFLPALLCGFTGRVFVPRRGVESST